MKEKINQTAGRLKQTVRAVGVGIATLTASFFMSAFGVLKVFLYEISGYEGNATFLR